MSDILDRIANYRKVKMLSDGSRLLLRPLVKEDKEALQALFARASRQDLEWFRSDAADPQVVKRWVEHIDYRRVLPLVALVGDELVGDATLHFGEHHHSHHAWVRIFLDRAYRRRGIGTMMLNSLIEIARQVGLLRLYAEIVTVQTHSVKAFKDLGFQHEATLEDYFATSDGSLLDVVIMTLPLVDYSGRF